MEIKQKVQSNSLICSSKMFRIKSKRENILSKSQICQQQVWFNHNDYANIVREICHINFSKIKLLQLSNNLIESIQYLQYLQAYNLEQLHISFNLITNIRILSKCYFPNLIKLSLMQNPIRQMEYLNLTYFPKLKQIFLQSVKQNLHNYPIKNQNFLIKSYPLYIEKIILTKQTSQKQPLLKTMLGKKKK